jgi:hypothetical protein
MAEDQQARGDITGLKKSVEDANDRTLRLGEKVQDLKDYIQTDLALKGAKIEGRSEVMSVALSIYMALLIGGGIQLYLLNGRLSAIERDVSNISKGIDELRLTKASENPTDPQSVQEVKRILAEAKAAKIRMSPEVVTTTAAKFIDAAQIHPGTWEAALAFVNYKSFLNRSPIPEDQWAGIRDSFTSRYSRSIPLPGHGKRPEITPVGEAPKDREAIIQVIDAPFVSNDKNGNRLVVLHDGDVLLDGTELRHVIVINAHVVYKGGPLIMQDVYFVNCTFDLPQQANTQNLATAILERIPVDFKAS